LKGEPVNEEWMFVAAGVGSSILTSILSKLKVGKEYKALSTFAVCVVVVAASRLIEGEATWSSLLKDWGVTFATATIFYRAFTKEGAPAMKLAMKFIAPVLLAVLVVGCSSTRTYNTNHFESGSIAPHFKIEPGQGGDRSSQPTAEAPGGAGKMSPGGSNVLDGAGQFAFIIQQSGETPSTQETSVDAKAAAAVGQAPKAAVGGTTGTTGTETPPVVPPVTEAWDSRSVKLKGWREGE
jgi:hypothetical protein